MTSSAASTEHTQLAILPGLLCDPRMFRAQAQAFSGATILGGYYEGCQSLADMAAYALDRLPGSFALVGHSMGARVALEIMRVAPERVERLVLANTGVHPVGQGERERRYALRDVGRANGIEKLVAQWLPPMLAPHNAGLASALVPMCVDAGQHGFERQIEALLNRPAVDELLPSINCPTLVIVGEHDAWSPVAQHEAIAAAIPGAVLRVVPEAGHMLPFEAPDEFNRELADWLQRPLH